VQDIIGLYDASKHPDVISKKRTATEVLREFLETFDVGGEVDGIVTLSEWENYYANISASIDDDDYFELMIRNAWHISGGEGWCANTANRRVLVTNADGSQSVVEIKYDLGLKADDKQGMVARLRAQGVNAASVELYGGGVDGVSGEQVAKKVESAPPPPERSLADTILNRRRPNSAGRYVNSSNNNINSNNGSGGVQRTPSFSMTSNTLNNNNNNNSTQNVFVNNTTTNTNTMSSTATSINSQQDTKNRNNNNSTLQSGMILGGGMGK
jgi:hypothetical protein